MVELLPLKVSQYIIALFFYLLKQNRIIVHDEIYRKDPKFLDRSNGQTMQTEISIGLIRVTQLPFCCTLL